MNGYRLTENTSQYFDNGLSDSSEGESGPDTLDYVNVVPQTTLGVRTGQIFQNGYDGSSEDETEPGSLDIVNVLPQKLKRQKESLGSVTVGPKILPTITKGRKFLNGGRRISDDEDGDPINNLTHVNNFKRDQDPQGMTKRRGLPRMVVPTKTPVFVNGGTNMSTDEDDDPIKNLTHVNNFKSSVRTKREQCFSHTGVQTNASWTDSSKLYFNNGNQEESSHSEGEDNINTLTVKNNLRPDSQGAIRNNIPMGIDVINSNLNFFNNGLQNRFLADNTGQYYNEKANEKLSKHKDDEHRFETRSSSDNDYCSTSDEEPCIPPPLTFKNNSGPNKVKDVSFPQPRQKVETKSELHKQQGSFCYKNGSSDEGEDDSNGLLTHTNIFNAKSFSSTPEPHRQSKKDVTAKQTNSNKDEFDSQKLTENVTKQNLNFEKGELDKQNTTKVGQNTITNHSEYLHTENDKNQERDLSQSNRNKNHEHIQNTETSSNTRLIFAETSENTEVKTAIINSENRKQHQENIKQEHSLANGVGLQKVRAPDYEPLNIKEPVSDDMNKTIKTSEVHMEQQDIETHTSIDIRGINKVPVVARKDMPFRNSFGPSGLRSFGKNLFEVRLQENNFPTHETVNSYSSFIKQHKTTMNYQSTELSTQLLKDDYLGGDDDLEIDGEKSHTFKEPLKEKRNTPNNREKHTPLPQPKLQLSNTTHQGHMVSPLSDVTSPILNTTPKGNVKSPLPKTTPTFTRQYSIGAYGHTCSGCGRKDCDGNFMRLLREMIRTGRKKGFEIRNVVPDGNCMFAAVIDQLELVGDCQTSPFALRQSCTQYLKENPTSQDGTPFHLFLDGESWEDYLSRMGQEGQWGDHLMLQAISSVTQRTITVINGDDDKKWANIHPSYTTKQESLYLGHVGELHYVSMRPVVYKEFAEDEFMSIDLYSPLPSLPNMEDAMQQQMFKEEYVDPWCDIPAIHLTFLIKQFIPLKSTLKNADSMCHQAFAIESSTEEYMGQRSDTGRTINIKAIGDVVEGLFASSLDEQQQPESSAFGEWADVGIIYSPTSCIAYPSNMNNIGTIDPSDVSVDTKYTHPGYVRLLARYPDTWGLEEADQSDMSYFIPNTHKRFEDSEDIKRFKDQYSNQNPAIVYLFRRMFSGVFSPFWPEEASEWRSRSRDSGWPSPGLIDSIVSEGVYYISQPHVNSLNPSIEFQTSFAVAERRLANEGLSKEQRYCFIVFKALISHTLMGDDLITSNHLKSIFFQASEVIPQQYWGSRLSACIFYMVDSLTRQLECGVLPNYFILANNMIDHLTSDQIQSVQEKLSNLRTNPVSVLYSIAYQNMVTNADDIFQEIRHDIDNFQQHKSVRQSVIETLVPVKIKQAAKYIEVNNYDIALEIIQEAHEDRLMVSTCEDNIPFVAFVTEVTNSFGLSKQWWLCLHADETLGTTLSTDLSLQQDPIPLREIVGNDTADKYGELLIPRPLAENLFSLCTDFFLYLRSKHKTKKAVAFLVKGREFFLQIQQFGGLPSEFPCTINADNYNISNIYKIYDYLLQSFVITMSPEPLCTLRLDEIANEVQAIFERVNSEESYTALVMMWKFLGNTEKFNQASRRLDEITMNPPASASTS